MLHIDNGTVARPAAPRRRTGIIILATLVVAACNADSHPAFVPCGALDAATVGVDAGPDAGQVAIGSCGDPKTLTGVAVPPGGPPTDGAGGGVNRGSGGTGAGVGGNASPGIGGNGVSSGGITGTGAGGVSSGIGGSGIGGGAVAGPGGSGVGNGTAGAPQTGLPGSGGIGP